MSKTEVTRNGETWIVETVEFANGEIMVRVYQKRLRIVLHHQFNWANYFWTERVSVEIVHDDFVNIVGTTEYHRRIIED